MADRHDIRPTAGMLGNQGIQDLEASLQRKPGSGPTIDAARLQARQEMTNAVQGVANAQGATTARPTVIGQQARTVAGNALDALERESSAAQHTLEHDVGERTPINVGGLDRQMADLIGQHPSDSRSRPASTRCARCTRRWPQASRGRSRRAWPTSRARTGAVACAATSKATRR
jgi:hypothetical protein